MRPNLFAITTCIVLMSAAQAEDAKTALVESKYRLLAGSYKQQSRYSFAYVMDSGWKANQSWGSISLLIEPEIALWRTPVPATGRNKTVWQLSLNPIFIFDFKNHWYAEAGVGITYLGDQVFNGKLQGSRFNFSDTLGVGYRVSKNLVVGYRYSHFSNLSIKKPNPGLDMHQIMFSAHF